MPVPNAGKEVSLQWDLNLIIDAFGGCGVDEDKIIRVLCSRAFTCWLSRSGRCVF